MALHFLGSSVAELKLAVRHTKTNKIQCQPSTEVLGIDEPLIPNLLALKEELETIKAKSLKHRKKSTLQNLFQLFIF